MARITNVSFQHNDSTYTLSLDFDDAALVENTIAFDVTAERVGGKLPPLSISARVEIHPVKEEIIVSIGEVEVLRVKFSDAMATPVERFIESIPAGLLGDPITACAIKAGVSAIIGQAINCCRSLEGNPRWRIVPEFFRCMGQHFGEISKTAMFRAFKCILHGGI